MQKEVPEHCFSKYDQELFTSNTGVEVKLVELVTRKGSSKVVCPLTGLFSRGRRLERDFEGPIEGNGASFSTSELCLLLVMRWPFTRGWGFRWQPLQSTGLLASFLWAGLWSCTTTNPVQLGLGPP